MRHLAVVTLACLLAGCTNPDPIDPEVVPCSDLNFEGTCIQVEGFSMRLEQCVQARLIIDLRESVYDLPEGYSNSATATSPQRLSFVPMRCQVVTWGNESAQDVSISQLGVLVEAGDRAQDADVDVYTLEAATDSPLLASVLRHLGFNVVNGTVDIQDSGATRTVAVTGPEVDYQAMIEFVPQADGTPLPGSLAHHAEIGWYSDERACIQYFSNAHGQVTANQGVLQQASPAVGPILGSASQAIACNATWDFHRF